MIIHNCHLHTFTSRAAPNGLLSFGMMRLTRTRWLAGLVRGVLDLVPSSRISRLSAFLGIGGLKSQEEVLRSVTGYYPSDTRFVILSLDFEHAGAGRSPQSYLEQLEELRELKKSSELGPRILPFVSADPRRRDVLDLVKEYLEEHDFAGIKLYPPLGFYPCDPRLDPVYEYAQTHDVPILTHCARGGVYYRGRITDEMRRHPRENKVFQDRGNARFTQRLTDPNNYRLVLKDFPNLKINFAHLGGSEEWDKYLHDPWPKVNNSQEESWLSVICNFIREYEQVYGDVSFVAAEEKYWPLMERLLNMERVQDRVLFGTDYYMVRRLAEERLFSMKLRSKIGETEYHRMADINARAYLGLPAEPEPVTQTEDTDAP